MLMVVMCGIPSFTGTFALGAGLPSLTSIATPCLERCFERNWMAALIVAAQLGLFFDGIGRACRIGQGSRIHPVEALCGNLAGSVVGRLRLHVGP
jgi:hypothetical protein